MFKVIFYCPADHHLCHALPVIRALIKTNKCEVFFVSQVDTIIPGVVHCSKLTQLPIGKYDVYISTEQRKLPIWVRSKIKIFFGHGVGPKLGYQRSERMAVFNYSFAPCAAILDAHAEMGIETYPTGLPILDNMSCDLSFRTTICRELELESSKPLVVYVPSWANDRQLLQNIGPTIRKLATWKNCKVVISPHPNLLDPGRCSGATFFADLPANISLSCDFPTFEMIKLADFVVGDISSSMFEAMAMGKLVFWDGDAKFYNANEAARLLPSISAVCPVVTTYTNPATEELFREMQKEFIQNYIHNIGCSTDVVLSTLFEILERRS